MRLLAHDTDNRNKGRDARTEELTKGYFLKLCESKGKGQRERRSRGVDFSPLERLIYTKVVLNNKKGKKKPSFLALSFFTGVQCFNVRQKYVLGGGHEEPIKEIQKTVDFIFAVLVCRQNFLERNLNQEDP